jgi:hypothetical protein
MAKAKKQITTVPQMIKAYGGVRKTAKKASFVPDTIDRSCCEARAGRA